MNNSSNIHVYHDWDNSYFSKGAHIGILIVYMCLSLVNFFANSVLFIVIVYNRKLWTSMNLLLAHLSFCDLITALSVYPYLFVLDTGKLSTSTSSRNLWCGMTEGLGMFFTAAGTSLLTLCAISYNRFVALQFPTRRYLLMKRHHVVYFAIGAWSFAISCMVPGVLSYKYYKPWGICLREFRLINGTVYRVVMLLIGLFLPSGFLVLSFCGILHQVRKQTPFTESSLNQWRALRLRKAERTLGLLIAINVFCWLPFCFYWGLATLTSYFPTTHDGVFSAMRWLRFTVLLCTFNATIDPIVFSYSSSLLKEYLKTTLRSLFCLRCLKSVNQVHPTVIISNEKYETTPPGINLDRTASNVKTSVQSGD